MTSWQRRLAVSAVDEQLTLTRANLDTAEVQRINQQRLLGLRRAMYPYGLRRAHPDAWGASMQSLNHFRIGVPVDDPRLTTLPPYEGDPP